MIATLRHENGATGVSDMAGNAARVAVEPSGSERDTTQATTLLPPAVSYDDRRSFQPDCERSDRDERSGSCRTARVCGRAQRELLRYNGATGVSDIAG